MCLLAQVFLCYTLLGRCRHLVARVLGKGQKSAWESLRSLSRTAGEALAMKWNRIAGRTYLLLCWFFCCWFFFSMWGDIASLKSPFSWNPFESSHKACLLSVTELFYPTRNTKEPRTLFLPYLKYIYIYIMYIYMCIYIYIYVLKLMHPNSHGLSWWFW